MPKNLNVEAAACANSGPISRGSSPMTCMSLSNRWRRCPCRSRKNEAGGRQIWGPDSEATSGRRRQTHRTPGFDSPPAQRRGVPAACLTRKCDDLLLFPGWTKGWRQARSSALHAVTSRPLTTPAKQAAREPATLCIRSPSATGSCGRRIALCGSVALQTQNFAHLCSVQLPGALAQTGRSLPRRLLHHEDDPEEALEAAFR